MKPNLPGHVPMLVVHIEPDDARAALLILSAKVLELEGWERPVSLALYGAVIALEEALGTTAAELMAGRRVERAGA